MAFEDKTEPMVCPACKAGQPCFMVAATGQGVDEGRLRHLRKHNLQRENQSGLQYGQARSYGL